MLSFIRKVKKTTRLGPGSAQSGASSTPLALVEGLEGDASGFLMEQRIFFPFIFPFQLLNFLKITGLLKQLQK